MTLFSGLNSDCCCAREARIVALVCNKFAEDLEWTGGQRAGGGGGVVVG